MIRACRAPAISLLSASQFAHVVEVVVEVVELTLHSTHSQPLNDATCHTNV